MLLKWLLALALIAHGVGHITGVSAFWTKLPIGFNQNPWIFDASGTLTSLAGRIFGVIWLAATVSLIAAGVGDCSPTRPGGQALPSLAPLYRWCRFCRGGPPSLQV